MNISSHYCFGRFLIYLNLTKEKDKHLFLWFSLKMWFAIVVVCRGLSWFSVVRRGSTWFAMVRHGSTWFDVARCSSPWFVVVRRGLSWFVVVRCGSSSHTRLLWYFLQLFFVEFCTQSLLLPPIAVVRYAQSLR